MKKIVDETEQKELPRMPWDLSLVMLATVYILMRLSKIGITFISPPGPVYLQTVLWVGYPFVALLWGIIARLLQFKFWWMIIIGLIAMAGGLFFGHGAPHLIYLPIYLIAIIGGYYGAGLLPKPGRRTNP